MLRKLCLHLFSYNFSLKFCSIAKHVLQKITVHVIFFLFVGTSKRAFFTEELRTGERDSLWLKDKKSLCPWARNVV